MSTAAQSSTVNKNFIGGTWLYGVNVVEDINPPNTKDVVGHFAQGDAAQVSAAVGSAKAAFPAWSRSNPQVRRRDVLKRVGDEIMAREDELGHLLSQEEGKTVPEGVGELVRALQIFPFFSGECVRLPGEKISSVRSGLDIGDHPRADRRCWPHHTVEMVAPDRGRESRGGMCHRIMAPSPEGASHHVAR
jgi:acyl-CoA reductase-like NAD-dependent aldehyde dehydrogenase